MVQLTDFINDFSTTVSSGFPIFIRMCTVVSRRRVECVVIALPFKKVFRRRKFLFY